MTTPRPLTIVAFGDSITAAGEVPPNEKWVAVLEKALAKALPQRAVRVVNAGVGGNTSREALARHERDVLPHRPDILLIQFGGNDGTMETHRTVPVAEYLQNVTAIIARTKAQTPCAFALITFPPVVDADHQHGKHPHFKEAGGPDNYLHAYRNATRAYAKEHKLPLADIDTAIRADLKRHVLPDGVHLTTAGNQTVADVVLPVVVGLVR
ncbi:MAG: SGNH/GDSL hydrolase family protein [Planctomycetota bacterium]|nr:SGNH/GDSL hydrolase family protein [Planctomycetota bacterium]